MIGRRLELVIETAVQDGIQDVVEDHIPVDLPVLLPEKLPGLFGEHQLQGLGVDLPHVDVERRPEVVLGAVEGFEEVAELVDRVAEVLIVPVGTVEDEGAAVSGQGHGVAGGQLIRPILDIVKVEVPQTGKGLLHLPVKVLRKGLDGV